MSDPTADTPAAKRKTRTPGGDPTADTPAAAESAVESVEGDAAADDPRTPGLVVNDDGSIAYAGKSHRRPFMTPHGMVVPPASVEAPGLKGRG